VLSVILLWLKSEIPSHDCFTFEIKPCVTPCLYPYDQCTDSPCKNRGTVPADIRMSGETAPPLRSDPLPWRFFALNSQPNLSSPACFAANRYSWFDPQRCKITSSGIPKPL
jgi:hypothetical protein